MLQKKKINENITLLNNIVVLNVFAIRLFRLILFSETLSMKVYDFNMALEN